MIDVEKLKGGNTLCVFIRHGEKDINSYGLTDRGKDEIIHLSQLLCVCGKPIRVYTSPEHRCVETAAIMNEIVNGSDGEVCFSTVLGKPGIQVKDESIYTGLTDSMRCRDIFKEWKQGLHYDAMNSWQLIKERMMEFFYMTCLRNGLTIYISQSGTVACTGFALGLTDYKATDEEWVDYLDGYVLRI